MNEKILKRAKALLAMSQDASSENEAMIAARRLHSLLSKHNISLSQLEDKPEQPYEVGFESINWPWRRTILKGVSDLYFCKSYYAMTRKNYANYFIIGTEINRTFAMGIVKNIFNVIEVAAKNESIKTHGKIDSNFISSFRNGASIRVYERCMELIEASKCGNLIDEETEKKLPTLLSLYEQSKLANDLFADKLNLRKSESHIKAKDRLGFKLGEKAGDKVQLSRTLHSDNSPKLIGG